MESTAERHIVGGARFVGALTVAALLSTFSIPATAPAATAVTPAFQHPDWKDPDGNPLPFRSDAEIIEFLRSARIESSVDIPMGVTNPRQVILQKDGVSMRAVLRDYDETFEQKKLGDEFFARLRDSFVFDVSAYKLARLLDLDNIPPVTFRRIGDQRVTLQAWLEGALMEADRVEQGLSPQSFQRHREQMQNMWVFDSLIGNVDRHARNFLWDEEGDLWLIDHSRSFRRNDDTRYLEKISMCGRALFERVKTLRRDELLEVLSPPLTESEVDWVLRRRDKVVDHIEELIATRGDESIVLFDDSR